VIRDLSTIVDKSEMPANEAQARELIPIKTPEKRVEAWQKVRAAAADSRPITAHFIRETLAPSKSDAQRGSSYDRAKTIRLALKKVRGMFVELPGSFDPARTLINKLGDLAHEPAPPDSSTDKARKIQALLDGVRGMFRHIPGSIDSARRIINKLGDLAYRQVPTTATKGGEAEELRGSTGKQGETVSLIAIRKGYGRHGVDLLEREHLEDDRKGWFKIVKDLPSPEEFKLLRQTAFSKPLKDLIDEAAVEATDLRDELQEWYDHLPEQFQGGEKGTELEQAIGQLEDSLSSIEGKGDSIPAELAHIAVYAEPGTGNSRSARSMHVVYQLRQAAEKVGAMQTVLEALKDDLESAASEMEEVEFPGMY
jgi:hypothetical protein